jgi:DNA-binding NarL/FixJ family response regulator
MIRILMIEDLAVVRESLAMALSKVPDMKVQCCASPEQGIDLLNGSYKGCEIVLLKLSAGGRRADELISAAIRSRPAKRVLIMTPGLSDLEQRRLTGLGVAGIFAKQGSLADLIGAIREVGAGRTWFGMQPTNEVASKGTLSSQESRAGELVLEGLTNKGIATRMSVSESCIKALLQRVFLKMGVHTRGQLVRILMEKSMGAALQSVPYKASYDRFPVSAVTICNTDSVV